MRLIFRHAYMSARRYKTVRVVTREDTG